MNRRMAIVAIIVGLFGIAACTIIMNPGPYGFGGW